MGKWRSRFIIGAFVWAFLALILSLILLLNARTLGEAAIIAKDDMLLAVGLIFSVLIALAAATIAAVTSREGTTP